MRFVICSFQRDPIPAIRFALMHGLISTVQEGYKILFEVDNAPGIPPDQ
jgi:hypothetical protein